MSILHANPQHEGLRKAAILVCSLEQADADALLEQMGEAQAARVRQVMVDLGDINPREQQQVLEEFFRIGPMLPKSEPAGIELDGRLARKLGLPGSCPDLPAATGYRREALVGGGPKMGLSPWADADSGDSPPFQFLEEAETDKLARVLAGERPQTAALVLSHLSAMQAGAVLTRLPPPQQVEIIRRLVDLEETDPEILREVERGLQSRLSQQVRMQRSRVAGLAAVDGILKAAGGRAAVQILDNLAHYDRSLAERLSPPPLAFDRLEDLDDEALDAVLEAAEPRLVRLALVGAAPQLIDRFVANMSPAEADRVRYELDHPGPIRLSDMEAARRQLADLAGRLSAAGCIRLPRQSVLEAVA
jgi:flagellar motor switch protein FliG